MTEQELREKIANLLYGELTYRNYLAIPEVRHNADIMISKVLAIIKDAGYKSGEEVYNQTMQAKKSGWDDCEKWYKSKSYVKLAEEQTLPPILTSIVDSINRNTLRILLEAGWRKVELEGKDVQIP